MMSTDIRQIKLGITGVKPSNLVKKANVIIMKMTDNPNFPNPSPAIGDIVDANDKLQSAMSEASNGDRNKIFVRNNALEELKHLLRGLGHYVSTVGNGNGNVLSSSGFELQKLREPMPPVTNPKDVLAVRDQVAGTIKLRWKAVKGAKIYAVEISKQNEEGQNIGWQQAVLTSKARAVVEDLELGIFYNFRVKAVGKKNESGWSEQYKIMAA